MNTRAGGRSLLGLLSLVALPIGLFAVGQVEIWAQVSLAGIGATTDGPRWALAITAAVVPLALWERRRYPVGVAGFICVVVAAQVLFIAPGVSLLAGLFPVLVAVYTAAAYGRDGWRVVALVSALAVDTVFTVRIPAERVTGEVLFGLFVIVGAWLVGEIERTRRQRVAGVAGELARVESERDAMMASALADERAAIARELHDVIAHGVSVMGVQAAGAHVLVDVDPGEAKATLRAIEAQARESIAELQRLLGVLRDSADPGSLEPRPGLHQLPALVDQMGRAGVIVGLCIEGSVRPLPAGVDLAAYRVVQEALTNVIKHAGKAPAQVHVRYDRTAVAVDVRDLGPAQQDSATPGHGLIGMRERIALYGGTLTIDRPVDGGFRISARFPVEPSE